MAPSTCGKARFPGSKPGSPRCSCGTIDLQYDRAWPDWTATLPVSLSLSPSLREDRYIGAPVMNVSDNLLLDRDSIRWRIAARVGADGIDAYSLLSALGHDCVGALQFLPQGVDPVPPAKRPADRSWMTKSPQ